MLVAESSHRESALWLSESDLAVLCLIFGDVVLKSQQKPLGVFRGHDYPVGDLRLGQSRKHGREIKNEFAVGMGDYHKVGI